MNTASWTSATRDRIRDVQDNLLAMAAWANASQADEEALELLLSPYRELVESLYERDMPLAKLADGSDLLLHVQGSAASGPSPKVSFLARLLTRTRDQVTALAKEIAGVTALRVPPTLDMSFTGVAGGSLFIGFSADVANEGDSTRDAIRKIAEASVIVSKSGSAKDLAQRESRHSARPLRTCRVRVSDHAGSLRQPGGPGLRLRRLPTSEKAWRGGAGFLIGDSRSEEILDHESAPAHPAARV